MNDKKKDIERKCKKKHGKNHTNKDGNKVNTLDISGNIHLDDVLILDDNNFLVDNSTSNSKKYVNNTNVTEKEYLTMELNKEPLLLNLKNNYLFYLSLLVGIYFICKKDNSSFVIGILNLIVISGLGYYVHYRAHTFNATKFYESSNNYFTKNKYINFLSRISCYFLDFHENIHHDTNINKKSVYILIEFILNFITQGGYIFIFYFLFKIVNLKIAFLWGMLYSTIHLFNYELIKPETHILHHKNKLTNLGLDIWDVLFNTKYEYDNYKSENINHAFINVGVLSWFLTKCL